MYDKSSLKLDIVSNFFLHILRHCFFLGLFAGNHWYLILQKCVTLTLSIAF